MEAKQNTILALSALLIILLACTLSPTPQPQPTVESSQHPSPTPRLPRPPLQPPLASPTRLPRDTQPATITPTLPTPPKATETRPVQPTQAETMDDPSVVFSQDYAGEDVSIYYAFLSEDGSSLVVFLDNSQIGSKIFQQYSCFFKSKSFRLSVYKFTYMPCFLHYSNRCT